MKIITALAALFCAGWVTTSAHGHAAERQAVTTPAAHHETGRDETSLPPLKLTQGAGVFAIDLETRKARIDVHYYLSRKHDPSDPIIIVLPGGGRNGDDYRDAWISLAEQYELLVLAPSFDETSFPGPVNYNLAGMIQDNADVRSLGNVVVRDRPETWLYAHLDQIFDAVVAATGSRSIGYDLFGHSAGGQIVHRLALFAPRTKMHRGFAANSGWYTTTDPSVAFPYGLSGAPISDGQLASAFSRQLTVLLGELDNENETRGDLRRTPDTDAQGLHRLARGRFFYRQALARAEASGAAFRWSLHIVPDVGHSYKEMSAAAAAYLYAK